MCDEAHPDCPVNAAETMVVGLLDGVMAEINAPDGDTEHDGSVALVTIAFLAAVLAGHHHPEWASMLEAHLRADARDDDNWDREVELIVLSIPVSGVNP